MKRMILLAAFTVLVAVLAGYVTAQSLTTTALSNTSFKIITEGYDWGPGISRLVIDTGRSIQAASVDKSKFSVYVERKYPGTDKIVQAMDWATMKPYDSKGRREITHAYVSDANGQAISAAGGRYITLAMKMGPDEGLSSPFNFDMKTFLNSYIVVEHTITQTGAILASDDKTAVSGLNLAPSAATATVNLTADRFDISGQSDFQDPKYGKISLRFAGYAPANDGKKHPLIIWLHGAGEGGTDPRILLLGNRVTALIDEPIQKIMGGAYVLAPQSPLVWMNNGRISYPEDGTTQYTGAVKHLIDTYVAANPGIDTGRIYIGGCSNGGYMTVNMLLNYPGFFAAAYPACEAYADRWISDAQIAAIKNEAIWFTQAKSDKIVKAAAGGYVVETRQRLLAAGAKDVHLSYWDKVIDLSGKWYKADGKTAYEYDGHWSWIYTLNNQCTVDFDGNPVMLDGKAVTIMEWLAGHRK